MSTMLTLVTACFVPWAFLATDAGILISFEATLRCLRLPTPSILLVVMTVSTSRRYSDNPSIISLFVSTFRDYAQSSGIDYPALDDVKQKQL